MAQSKADREQDCLYVVPDCSEDGPAVSSDCGHTSRVVRAWSQSRWRNIADPARRPEPYLVAICEDEEPA